MGHVTMLPPDGLDQETWMFQSSGSMEKGIDNLATGFGVFNNPLGEVAIQEREEWLQPFPLSTLAGTSSLTV